jgi:hypothetical protein
MCRGGPSGFYSSGRLFKGFVLLLGPSLDIGDGADFKQKMNFSLFLGFYGPIFTFVFGG